MFLTFFQFYSLFYCKYGLISTLEMPYSILNLFITTYFYKQFGSFSNLYTQ